MASVVGMNRSNDTMTNVSAVQEYMKTYGVLAEDVNIDDIGVGRGVCDRLKELGIGVNAVSVGAPAVFSPELFSNLKAELCWEARKWVMDPESRLDKRDQWVQLTWLKYKEISDKRIQMEDKQRLKARAGASPDFAEAFYLTFAQQPYIGFI
jgi:hypothetical protein